MKLTEADLQMRRDGYVTAREVATAIGRNLTSVQRGVTDLRIPGCTVGSDRYKRYYVDVHKLIEQGDFADAPTASANLKKLASDVPARARPVTPVAAKPKVRRARRPSAGA